MAQQSLEELSSIYSEASELGLTPLGVGQPQQVQDIIQHSTAAGPSQLEARSGGGGGGDSDQGTPDGPVTKKRRTNYSYIPEDVKRKVVDYAVQHGTRPAARLFNISEGTIRSWKMRGFEKPTPSIARGRKVTYGKDLDDELYLGLMAMISEKALITLDQFTEYAKKIIDERRPDLNFKCSRGWIDKFLHRHKLTVAKSDSSKLMHIVEQSELLLDKPGTGNFNEPPLSYMGVESNMEIPTTEEEEGGEVAVIDSPFVIAANLSTCNSPPGGLELGDGGGGGSGGGGGDSSENGSLILPNPNNNNTSSNSGNSATGRVPSGYNTYLQSEISGTLSEREQKKQRDAAKSLHVIDIMGKLDVVSTSSTSTSSLDGERRMEVVRHAQLHGSRSAERKYGVPETTVKFWLKKMSPSHLHPHPHHATPTSSSEQVFITQGSSRAEYTSTIPMSSLHRSVSGGCASSDGHGRGEGCGQSRGGVGDAETELFAWAMELRRSGAVVTFDGLCDQALCFVSQGNPGSAFSSTRKWVDQFLNLTVRDMLDVQM